MQILSLTGVLSILSAYILIYTHTSVADVKPCDLSLPATQQAKCLLRKVKQYGHLGPVLTNLPAALESRIGRAIDITKAELQAYLFRGGLSESKIGGPLTNSVSQTRKGEFARYFIIHDTSYPVYKQEQEIPGDINLSSWPGNDLDPILKASKKKAHAYINRVGDSATILDFKTPYRSTKFELASNDRKGLFLGVELIQPRRRDAKGIDAHAPDPGFTDAQYDRLSLLYIAASVRRGEWLIPAFHAVLDTGIPDGHDDPQNFDLEHWAKRLEVTANSI